MGFTIVEVYAGCFELTVSETGASSTSETRITGVPIVGNVRRVQFQFVSGAGTNGAPILGKVTDPTSASATDIVVEPVALADAAAQIDRCCGATYVCSEIEAGGGVLYHQPRIDAGSDNVAATVYHLTVGW